MKFNKKAAILLSLLTTVCLTAATGCNKKPAVDNTKYNDKTAAQTYAAIEKSLADNKSNATVSINSSIAGVDDSSFTQSTKVSGDNYYYSASAYGFFEEKYYVDGTVYENDGENKTKQTMTKEEFCDYAEIDLDSPIFALPVLSSTELDGVEFTQTYKGAAFTVTLSDSHLVGYPYEEFVGASAVQMTVNVSQNSELTSVALSANENGYEYNVTVNVFDLGSTIVSAPADADSYQGSTQAAYIHRVQVATVGGYPFSDVTVELYDGGEKIASKKTDTTGFARFYENDVAEAGSYEIKISGYPKGYAAEEENYTTIALAGTETIISLVPGGVIKEQAPFGNYYSLGDIMYDFSIVTSDNTTFTLSEVLKEKDMVLINFWATWCGPCKSEFPAMNNAYIQYQDDVAILAVSTTDPMHAVRDFKSSNGLSFSMANDSIGLQNMFNTSAIPVSIMVDRYGVISFMHGGSMTATTDFTSRFELFVGDEYTPIVIRGTGDDIVGGGGGSDGGELIKPTVDNPSIDDVNKVLDENNRFDFAWEEDEYSWPWLVSEDEEYLYASNKNVHGSYAILNSTFTAKAGDVVAFDYIMATEYLADYFYVMIDNQPIHTLSGFTGGWEQKVWNTCYAYVFKDYEAGEHKISFVYMKDVEKSADDVVYLKNLRVTNEEELDSPTVDTNILRQAATVYNTDENATTQFKNYITPVFNEEDGYYHVNDVDGPILFANLLQASSWNETSVWLLAFNNYCVVNGFDYRDFIEDYAWEASQHTVIHGSQHGFTPVTEELKTLLDLVVEYVKFGKIWDGKYHANEWLELCLYYDHYGQSEPMPDPLRGISFAGAIEMQEGSNTIDVLYAMTPRGFKYKFTPEKSGVYHVYSTGEMDTEVFLMASDRMTFLGTYTDKVFADSTVDENGMTIVDGNFEFYYAFEEGELYYMLFTTFLDVAGSYNVEIEYVGETYTYLDNCAVGPYSANMVTFEIYIPGAIDYAYSDPATGGDGYYHYVDENGELGSIIYLDVNRPTAFFNSISLYDICRDAQKYAPEKRAFYVNGHDYTPDIQLICFQAMQNEGELEGFAAVDQNIFEILQTITMQKYEGLYNSWLMLCYYYVTMSV
ncbi:MAG: TlpA family protein disulfide reductase [Clostridia bacterium]|nr:TlpA family protein disulfide reductase [Clostridia bacterium]